MRKRVRELWEEAEIKAIVDSMIDKADTWKDINTMYHLVYDEESDDLIVVAERKGTKTPSFVYLFSVEGYYFLEDDDFVRDSLYDDLIKSVPKAIKELEE